MNPAQTALIEETLALYAGVSSTHYEGCYLRHAGCLAARLHALDDEEDQ